MEKRLFLAVVLMLAVVFLVNILFPPVPPPPTVGADSLQVAPAPAATPEPAAERPALPAARADTLLKAPAALERPAGPEEEDTVWVTTPLVRLGFADRGARLVSAEMLQFESLAPESKGRPVQLVPPGIDDFLSHQWLVGNDTLDLRRVRFDVEPRDGLTLGPDSRPSTLRFLYSYAGTDFQLVLEYTFRPDRYVVRLRGRLAGVPTGGWWAIGLGPGLLSNEWDPEVDYKANLAFAAKGLHRPKSQRIADVEPGERVVLDGPFNWVAVRTKYFVAALVRPPEAGEERQFAGLLIRGLPEPYRAEGVASFPVGRGGDFFYDVYIGPQDYSRLSAVGHDLDQVTPYGYAWAQPVLRPLAAAITTLLVWMHKVLGVNYGWILIFFGVGIRIVLFPLYQKSMRSQMATMRVQPLMKEIQEKYKHDPQRLQQEMVKLYREHKINPLGGCLPMLLPFPILIALFFVFRDTIEFRGVPFLWLPDLSRPDPLYIIPVFMGLSIFALQWVSLKTAPQANPQMKVMMWVMPVLLTVLFLKFASGLNLYYATMNLASLPQQLYLARERRRVGADTPSPREKKAPGPKKPAQRRRARG